MVSKILGFIKSHSICIIIGLLELLVIILLLTRLNDKEIEIKYEYLPGDTIYMDPIDPTPILINNKVDTTDILEYCLANNLYLEYFLPDTIVNVIDTVKVVQDWSNEVHYDIQLFDIDTVGTCSIKTYVQYNRLGPINTTFTPIHKVVTVTKPKLFEPFIGIGISTKLLPNFQAGMYYKNLGFSAQMVFGNEGAYAVGNLLMKF